VENEMTGTSKKTGRLVRYVFLSLFIIAVGLVGFWLFAHWEAARDRTNWKGPALQRLATLSATNENIARELADLRANPNGFDWTGDDVLLMTNGEYIIFAFRHGANNGFVDHLFLGHGSNGKWLYSTYHFCNMMAAVRMDNPPGSIADFEKRYAVREFDGKSDECLRHTWP